VSRQYLYLRSDWRSGRRWTLDQSTELDLNGGWRRSSGRGAVSLTNVFVSAGYRPGGRASFGASFDGRRNCRTWENRGLADSLFDAAFRSGLRIRASLGLGPRWSFTGNTGWRGREGGGGDTWSWAAGLSREGLLARSVSLTVQAAGFSGPWARGLNPWIQLQKSFAAGHGVTVSSGTYSYRPDAGGATAGSDGAPARSRGARRANSWIRFSGTRQLPGRCFLNGEWERDWGDDARGDRFLAGAGVGF
jgi:hypothetical protein